MGDRDEFEEASDADVLRYESQRIADGLLNRNRVNDFSSSVAEGDYGGGYTPKEKHVSAEERDLSGDTTIMKTGDVTMGVASGVPAAASDRPRPSSMGSGYDKTWGKIANLVGEVRQHGLFADDDVSDVTGPT